MRKQKSCLEKEIMQETMPGTRRKEDHERPGWTTSRRGQDSLWKSQSEWQRTEINGKGTSMMWPTLGSRTAKEQNRTGTSGYKKCWLSRRCALVQVTKLVAPVHMRDLVSTCQNHTSQYVKLVSLWSQSYIGSGCRNVLPPPPQHRVTSQPTSKPLYQAKIWLFQFHSHISTTVWYDYRNNHTKNNTKAVVCWHTCNENERKTCDVYTNRLCDFTDTTGNKWFSPFP